MFGGPEVSYHQTHSARDWLSILRTTYTTQNLQRKRRTDIINVRLFILLLFKMSLSYKAHRRSVGRLVNNEVGSMWKEAVVTSF
jgi:hypothetical protein